MNDFLDWVAERFSPFFHWLYAFEERKHAKQAMLGAMMEDQVTFALRESLDEILTKHCFRGALRRLLEKQPVGHCNSEILLDLFLGEQRIVFTQQGFTLAGSGKRLEVRNFGELVEKLKEKRKIDKIYEVAALLSVREDILLNDEPSLLQKVASRLKKAL